MLHPPTPILQLQLWFPAGCYCQLPSEEHQLAEATILVCAWVMPQTKHWAVLLAQNQMVNGEQR